MIIALIEVVRNRNHRTKVRVDFDLKDRLISLSAKSGSKCMPTAAPDREHPTDYAGARSNSKDVKLSWT